MGGEANRGNHHGLAAETTVELLVRYLEFVLGGRPKIVRCLSLLPAIHRSPGRWPGVFSFCWNDCRVSAKRLTFRRLSKKC